MARKSSSELSRKGIAGHPTPSRHPGPRIAIGASFVFVAIFLGARLTCDPTETSSAEIPAATLSAPLPAQASPTPGSATVVTRATTDTRAASTAAVPEEEPQRALTWVQDDEPESTPHQVAQDDAVQWALAHQRPEATEGTDDEMPEPTE